jgi:predicted nucleotidyltransferase
MTLSPDFREFIRLLNENKVRYLIVGGYAVAFHGHPRYTKDLDVWIEGRSSNIRRLLRALDAFGFGTLDLTVDDFLEPDTVVQLGRPPQRIDLLTDVDGVGFEESDEARRDADMDGITVRFIGMDQLRANKNASGRHQDRADLENLEDGDD